jgi:hypothetical protein
MESKSKNEMKWSNEEQQEEESKPTKQTGLFYIYNIHKHTCVLKQATVQ